MLVMDLDSYRLGAYRNDMGRMFGASRFMADSEAFRGPTRLLEVLHQATEPDPAARHPDYAAFHQAWRAARA